MAPGLGIEFLPVEEDLGLGFDLLDAVLGEGQHAAGAAAAVIDGAGHALATGQVGIKRKDQIHHEADDLTRGEVLTGVLVQRFIELPQQMLEDIPHLVVGHGGGAEVHLALLIEALHEQVKQPGPLQIADGVVEVEGGEDFPDVRGEAHDILPEVQRQMGVIVEEAFVVELGGVVEGVARRAAQLPVAVLQPLLLQRVLRLQHLGLGGLQRVVETAQDGEREDDFLKLALLESAVEQIGNRPEEADDVVEFGGFDHGIRRFSESGWEIWKRWSGGGERCRRSRGRSRPRCRAGPGS